MGKTITKIEKSIPDKIVLKRVAAYVRVSSGKDAMLHSLSAQVSFYSNLIQRHKGWIYAGVYADEALTGTKDTRENFQRLIADCRAGKIDAIITKSISRFARNTVALLETVRELKGLGIDVYFEEQNIHSLSNDGELMLTILASYAQEESRSVSENCKWRIRKRFEKGELVNMRFMFGYRVVKGKPEPDPYTAPIVKEVFERVISGESYSRIAADLNGRNIPTPLGGAWSARQISAMIINEKYMGDSMLQKNYRNNHLEKKHKINKGEIIRYYSEETHEGIIDKNTFELASAEYQRRYKQYAENRADKEYSVFSGLIYCPICGKNYRKVKNNGRILFGCSTYINKGKAYCKSRKIPLYVFEDLIKEITGSVQYSDDLVRDNIESITVSALDTIIFVLKNGDTIEKKWTHRSRSDSWTNEMKEKARLQAKERIMSNAECKKN